MTWEGSVYTDLTDRDAHTFEDTDANIKQVDLVVKAHHLPEYSHTTMAI